MHACNIQNLYALLTRVVSIYLLNQIYPKLSRSHLDDSKRSTEIFVFSDGRNDEKVRKILTTAWKSDNPSLEYLKRIHIAFQEIRINFMDLFA